MKCNDNATTLRLPCFKGVPPRSLGFTFQSSERFRPTSLVVLVVNSGNDEDDGNVGDMDFEEEKNCQDA